MGGTGECWLKQPPPPQHGAWSAGTVLPQATEPRSAGGLGSSSSLHVTPTPPKQQAWGWELRRR